MLNKIKKRLFVYTLPLKKLLLAGVFLAAVLSLLVISGPLSYLAFPGELEDMVMVVDPGHGGIDGGVSVGEILEKDINLRVARKLKKKLKGDGAAVVLTRKKDADVSGEAPEQPASRHKRDLLGRLNVINESEADLFVSLHVNSCEASYVRGAICFYHEDTPESVEMAEFVQESLNRVTGKQLRDDELLHRYTKSGYFSRLLNSAEPAGIIVEMGFITNPTDRKLLGKPSYRTELAGAIHSGIVDYVKACEARDAFSREDIKK